MLNVALNARDAMPDGGALTIRTSTVEVTEIPTTDEDLKPGAYALLELEDTGSGMPPEVVARVFEPFFTTKTGGHGTGLGLSMVYGFARQSGGTVTIDSSRGRGTTFRLFLPLVENEEAAPADCRRADRQCRRSPARCSSSRTKPMCGTSCGGSSRASATACSSPRPTPKRCCCFRGRARRTCC